MVMKLYERQFFYVIGYLDSIKSIEGIDLNSEVSRLIKLIKEFRSLENPFFVDIYFDLDEYQQCLYDEKEYLKEVDQYNSMIGEESTENPYYNENLDYDQQSVEFWNYIS